MIMPKTVCKICGSPYVLWCNGAVVCAHCTRKEEDTDKRIRDLEEFTSAFSPETMASIMVDADDAIKKYKSLIKELLLGLDEHWVATTEGLSVVERVETEGIEMPEWIRLLTGRYSANVKPD
jgi:uncharacterized Zn finger protein (UPF0148 family)